MTASTHTLWPHLHKAFPHFTSHLPNDDACHVHIVAVHHSGHALQPHDCVVIVVAVAVIIVMSGMHCYKFAHCS